MGTEDPWTTGARDDAITECVRCSMDHVVLESECIDRMYLNVYVPQLQRVGGVVWYLRGHLGQRFASTATVAPKTETFVANIEKFVAEQGVDLVSFGKHQRKDDITQQYLQRFDADEGILYVGRAQEKARVVRTERRRCARTGMSYPWVVDGSAMVNHYYFYCVDDDFGPFFLKFCSYCSATNFSMLATKATLLGATVAVEAKR